MNPLFDLPQMSLDKKIRLITTFSGIGAQEMAMKAIGADFEIYKAVEFDRFAINSYNAVHGTSFPVLDICNVHAKDFEIVDKENYNYIFVYSFPCFTADTLVLTNEGYKKIIDVKIGDYVLTHTNQWQKVLNWFDNGEHQIMKLKPMSADVIECTENHRFYVREMYRKYPYLENGKRCRLRLFKEPVWKECKDLTKNDYLGIAINQKSEMFEYVSPEKHHKGPEWTSISEKINLPSFWWLMGYYLGDGWQRYQESGIVLAANEKKLSKLKPVLEELNFNGTVSHEKTALKVHVCMKELCYFVQMFGKYAYGKKIPTEVLNLPADLLKSFLDGYFSADGWVKGNKIKCSSVSQELIYGIAQCVYKVYKRPVSIAKRDRSSKHIIEGREINQKPYWELSFKTTSNKQDKAFYEDGYIWCPIKKIEKASVQNVYDIEVEDDHSFTANGIIAHNCQALSLAGKMEGMKENSGTTSSLLWEIKRILGEFSEEELPDVLLMENVPQVHSEKNMPDFNRWIDFLRSRGYVNYYQDLNARDFGIPQNRERCFMVSVLSDKFIDFEFPKPIKLDRVMKDFLESEVDERYYINNEKAEKLIEQLVENGTLKDNKRCVDLCLKNPREIDVANCIKARYDAGISNLQADGSGVLEIDT